MSRIFAFLLLALCPAIAFGQTAEVSGTVMSSDGETDCYRCTVTAKQVTGLQGATVTYGSDSQTTKTASDGTWSLTLLRSTNYEFRFQYPTGGYVTQPFEIRTVCAAATCAYPGGLALYAGGSGNSATTPPFAVKDDGTLVEANTDAIDFRSGLTVTEDSGEEVDVAIDTATVATLAGTQTFSGNKTFSANVTVPATPTNSTHAASKGYVDALDRLANVNTDGSDASVDGSNEITIAGGDGITSSGASATVTLAVDSTVVRTSGVQNISDYKVFSVPMVIESGPTLSTHAVTRGYVDTAVAAATDNQTAAEVSIADSGDYYTGDNVEEALAELGATIDGGFATASHASTHQNGGADEVSVAGLSGQLADAQPLRVEAEGVHVTTLPTLNFVEGDNVTLTVEEADGQIDVTIAADASASAGNIFATIDAVAGTDIVADSSTDTLTLADGTGIDTSGDATTDTLTIAVDEAELTLSNIGGSVTDAQVPDTISLGAGASVSGVDLTLESAAAPLPTAEGETHWDTDDLLVIGTGSGLVTFYPGAHVDEGDTLTGDVTATFGSSATTVEIAAGAVGTTELGSLAVTNAKVNDVAEAKITFATNDGSRHDHHADDLAGGTLADARVAESNVTQHEAALTILEAQITDGTALSRAGDTFTGDVTGTLDTDGSTVLTIGANAVALGDDTGGNYVATIADAGNSTVTITGSGSESAAVTLNVVDVNCTGCLGATELAATAVSAGDCTFCALSIDADGRVTAKSSGTPSASGFAVGSAGIYADADGVIIGADSEPSVETFGPFADGDLFVTDDLVVNGGRITAIGASIVGSSSDTGAQTGSLTVLGGSSTSNGSYIKVFGDSAGGGNGGALHIFGGTPGIDVGAADINITTQQSLTAINLTAEAGATDVTLVQDAAGFLFGGASGDVFALGSNLPLYSTERIGIGGTTGGDSACIDNDTDRLFHDTDCDGSKESGEEFLDFTTAAVAFDAVTSGTNTSAAMIVGNDATLTADGTGIIEATDLACTGCLTATDLGADSAGASEIAAGAVGTSEVDDGTLVDADISASAELAVSKLAQGAQSQIIVTDGTDTPAWTTVGGDATLGTDGSLSLGTGVVGATELAATAVTAGSCTLCSVTFDADGRATAQSSGTATVTVEEGNSSVGAATNVDFGAGFDVTFASAEADIVLDYTEDPVNLSGGEVTGDLPVGSLADGTSAQVLMNSADPEPTWTTISGDVSLSATGVATIADDAVDAASDIDGYLPAAQVEDTSTATHALFSGGSGGDSSFRAIAAADLPSTATLDAEIDTLAELNTIVGDANLASLAGAETFLTGTKTVTAKFDFGGGTLELPNATTCPATCVVGETCHDTNATTGRQLYLCESTDTWVAQGTGTVAVEEGDAAIASISTIDFRAGFDLSESPSGEINVTLDYTEDPVGVADIDDADSPADEECLTYEGDTTNFEWQSCGTGPNGFTTMDASTGTDPVADSTSDTLLMTGTSPIVVTGDSTADSLTFSLTQNAGTDVTADLEEESHGAEHSEGGADALDLSTFEADDLSDVLTTGLADAHLLIYDNGDSRFENKAVSGDIAITAAGVTSVQSNAVALTTDTTGNYVASITNGSGITGGDGGSEGAALTLAATLGTDIAANEIADGDHGDFTYSGGSATIDANSVALGSDTTGNYAGSGSEGGAATTALALDANPTDCSAGQYARGIDADGTAAGCTSDDDTPESGDFGAAVDLEADGSLSADVVAAAEMADADHGDISWSSGVASVDANSIALTTDTTGNYVASITNGSGITGGDGGSEGAGLTIAATLGTDIAAGEIADGDHGAFTYASGVATLDASSVGSSQIANGSVEPVDVAPRVVTTTRRLMATHANAGATTVANTGWAGGSTGGTGSLSNADDADGPAVQLITAASGGSDEYVTGGVIQTRWNIDATWEIEPAALTANAHSHVGFYSADPTASSTPTAHLVGFRMVAGTTNYEFCTNDNTSTPTCTDTGVAIADGTPVTLRIYTTDAGVTLNGCVDSTCVSRTTDMPSTSTGLTHWTAVSATAASARRLEFGQLIVTHE